MKTFSQFIMCPGTCLRTKKFFSTLIYSQHTFNYLTLLPSNQNVNRYFKQDTWPQKSALIIIQIWPQVQTIKKFMESSTLRVKITMQLNGKYITINNQFFSNNYGFNRNLVNIHSKFFNKSTIDAQISFSGTPFIINIARWVGPLIEKYTTIIHKSFFNVFQMVKTKFFLFIRFWI